MMDIISYSKAIMLEKEVFSDEYEYLSPYAFVANCHCYIPNTKFFYGQNYNHLNVAVYPIKKNVEYTVSYGATIGRTDALATAETYFAVPASGYGTGVEYVEKFTAPQASDGTTTIKPSKDGYLYVQIPKNQNGYKSVRKTKPKAKTEILDAIIQKTAYKVVSNGIILSTKYDSTHDIQYTVTKHGLNELPDIQHTYIYENQDDIPSVHELADGNRVVYGNGDWHAPYQIKAVNNIDGDSTSGTWFTGGGHGYENVSSGGSKTARNAGIKYFADGKELAVGDEGVAESVVITWVNYIQASNTEKEDGTGREVLKETITMNFIDNVFHTRTVFEPLEDITCLLWYGLQLMYQEGTNKKIRYIGGTNRLAYSYDTASSSGDNTTNKTTLTNTDTNMVQEFSINPLVDIGKRENCASNLTNAMFGTTYGKAYATVINQSTSMEAGSMYVLEGEYRTYKEVVFT